MKVIAITVFLCAIFGKLNANPQALAVYQKADEADLAEEIKEVIDKIWSFMPSEIGIKDWDFTFPSNFFFGGKFDINDVSISGFKDLDMKVLKYDPENSRLDYEFKFGDIVGTIDYAFDITGVFKFDHHFTFHLDVKDITTQGYAVMDTENGQPKKIKDFSILVTIGESEFDVKGFLNNEEFSKKITEFLNKYVATTFDEMAPMLSPFFSEIIKVVINIGMGIFG